MAGLFEQRTATFGTNIYAAGDTAVNVADECYGRKLDYFKHTNEQLGLASAQHFQGQDEINVSIRPAAGGRCAVKVSTSVPELAGDFLGEMAQRLPE